MPIYEFACNKCNKKFSVVHSVQEHEKNPTPECQHCGSKKVSQQFSGVSVVTSKKS